MKIVTSEQATMIENSNTSHLLEYSILLDDKDIDCGVNEINGRYPEKGYCTNLKCKELAYILEGEGTISKKDGEVITFKKDDVILINNGDIYFWEGNCKIIMACTPAWYKDQCKLLD